MDHRKTRWAAAAALLVGLAGAGWAAKEGMKGAQDQKDVMMRSEDLQYKPGPLKGVQIASLYGDMDKGGPFGVMVRFDAGVINPLHWHTNDLKLVIVKGTFLHKTEDGKEMRFGPGSYLKQAGKVRHISGCADGGACEFFMSSEGKFDLNTVDGSEAKKGAKQR